MNLVMNNEIAVKKVNDSQLVSMSDKDRWMFKEEEFVLSATNFILKRNIAIYSSGELVEETLVQAEVYSIELWGFTVKPFWLIGNIEKKPAGETFTIYGPHLPNRLELSQCKDDVAGSISIESSSVVISLSAAQLDQISKDINAGFTRMTFVFSWKFFQSDVKSLRVIFPNGTSTVTSISTINILKPRQEISFNEECEVVSSVESTEMMSLLQTFITRASRIGAFLVVTCILLLLAILTK
jgi:hypothetical protein